MRQRAILGRNPAKYAAALQTLQGLWPGTRAVPAPKPTRSLCFAGKFQLLRKLAKYLLVFLLSSVVAQGRAPLMSLCHPPVLELSLWPSRRSPSNHWNGLFWCQAAAVGGGILGGVARSGAGGSFSRHPVQHGGVQGGGLLVRSRMTGVQ